MTGARGFTGRYLRARFEEAGHEVVPLASDLRDAQAVSRELKGARPDVVVHLAGIAFAGHDAVDDFYLTNLLGTRHLLEALVSGPASSDRTPRRVLLASTASMYGPRGGEPVGEDDPIEPPNHYAASKRAMEHMANLYRDRLPIVLVRPFNYTGRGQNETFLVPKIVQHFRTGARSIEMGALDVRRDFTDVRDVATAYLALIEGECDHAVYNICSGRTFSPREMLAACERITGRTIDVRFNPRFARNVDFDVVVGDNGRLLRVLDDWQPIAFEETLRWMLEASDVPDAASPDAASAAPPRATGRSDASAA